MKKLSLREIINLGMIIDFSKKGSPVAISPDTSFKMLGIYKTKNLDGSLSISITNEIPKLFLPFFCIKI